MRTSQRETIHLLELAGASVVYAHWSVKSGLAIRKNVSWRIGQLDRADGGEGKKRQYYVMRPSPLISGVNGAWLLGQKISTQSRRRLVGVANWNHWYLCQHCFADFAAAKRRLLPLTNRAAVKDHKLLLPQERACSEKGRKC